MAPERPVQLSYLEEGTTDVRQELRDTNTPPDGEGNDASVKPPQDRVYGGYTPEERRELEGELEYWQK